MSARDDYPRLAAFAEPGSINGKPHQTETGNEFARALNEVDWLRSRLQKIAELDPNQRISLPIAIEIAQMSIEVGCRRDTDGDGDCYIAECQRGGCIEKRAPR